MASTTLNAGTPVRGCIFGKRECGPAGMLVRKLGLADPVQRLLKLFIPPLKKAHEIIQMREATHGPLVDVTRAINKISQEKELTGMQLVQDVQRQFAEDGKEKTIAQVGAIMKGLMSHDNSDTQTHARSERAIKDKLQNQGITEEDFELAARYSHKFFAKNNERADGSFVVPSYQTAVDKHLEAQEIENNNKGIVHIEPMTQANRKQLQAMSIAA